MRVPFLALSRQVAELREDLDRSIAATLDAGTFVFGRPLEEFERAFAAHCGAAAAVGVASGTDAITIALEAVGVGRGDEVITAANAGVPPIAGIEGAGATPVLVDVDPETFTLDPERAEHAVTRRTRALLVVHLYGQCADMEPIVGMARTRGLSVVEDAAQAHGAEYGGRRAGSLGDAAAFSFYPTKNLGALGDGGAVVTDDPDVADAARLLRNYGERRRYESVRRGTNSRLDTLQAEVLLAKLRHLDGWNERRRAIAGTYREALADTVVGLPAEAPGRRHVFHLFVVRARHRDMVRARLEAAGVSTLVHYPRAVHRQPAYAELDRGEGRLEVTERLCDEVLSLPLHPHLTADEIDAVVSAVGALGGELPSGVAHRL